MKTTLKHIPTAEKYCQEHGLRLTPPRAFVLAILAEAKTPLGAYDILELLSKKLDKPKPPTVYRAIDFWREHGFVHKVESLNAYISCCEEGRNHHHDTHFLVCDDCSSVTELHVHNHNDQHALPAGFVPKRTFTETHGTCGACTTN